MKQIVEIDTGYGMLSISHKINGENNTFYTFDNISLKNIPITYDFTQNMPIIYNKSNEFANICLIEEFNYNLSFESNEDNLDVLHTLKNIPNESPVQLFNFGKNYKGKLQFSSYVGKTFIDIYKENECVFKLPIEVQTRKLNYANHYSKMISDLSQYSSGIIFELNSPSFQKFELEKQTNQTPYEKFMILEYIFRQEHLPSIVEYLSHNLYTRLENVKEEVPISFATNISPDDLIDAIIDSEKLNNNIPQFINETKYEDTIDIVENRFYKHYLELLNNLIDELLKQIPNGYAHDKLLAFENELDYYLSQRYFNDISRLTHIPLNSQVLQKKEGYRDILSYYLMFEFAFKLKWNDIADKFKGHEKKVFDLYEYWCYFELIKIMESITGNNVDFDDVFDISDDKLSIVLKKEISKCFNYNGLEINLLYNKKFKKTNEKYNSYSTLLKPDYTIEINVDNKIYFIHFDAKYKIDKKFDRFKREDMHKMHTYKDAIKNTIGAYVLYPGNDDYIYYENDGETKSVGAFSLIPGKENIDKIRDFLKDLLNFTP